MIYKTFGTKIKTPCILAKTIEWVGHEKEQTHNMRESTWAKLLY
jgi:hypothetical protein